MAAPLKWTKAPQGYWQAHDDQGNLFAVIGGRNAIGWDCRTTQPKTLGRFPSVQSAKRAAEAQAVEKLAQRTQ